MNEAVNVADAMNKAHVRKEIQSGPSFTTYTLCGEPRAVQLAIERIEREYHPMAYGTRARITDFGAVVTRANSAD